MQTLGDVVTAGLILAALIVVPYKIAKAWLWPYLKPMIMSRLAKTPPQKTDMEAVCIPVEQTDMSDGMDWKMPRISAYLTDQEFLVFLARQKLRDGKYRLSANKIVDAVGGDRNKTLDVVRQVRAAPEFPELSPEQNRVDVGLTTR